MPSSDREVLIQLKQHHSGKLHLKTDKNPDFHTDKTKNPGKQHVTWNIDVPKATVARFWFPDELDLQARGQQLFEDVQAIREIKLTGGQGSLTLKVRDDSPEGTYPYAVFCDLNGTVDPEIEQKGHQMVEGPHSHPDCNVGP